MFLFCYSQKDKQNLIDLNNFPILEDQLQSYSTLDQQKEILQLPIRVKIGKNIYNMQVNQEKIIFSSSAQKGKMSKQQKLKVLNLKKENLTFSIIYDVSYREKNRKPIGIKFIDYNRTIQSHEKCQTNYLEQQNINGTISNGKKNEKDKKVKKVSNMDLCDQQYPNISVFFDENVQLFQENLFEFLSKKIHQSDFRSIYKTIEVLGEGSSGTVFNVINRDTFQQYAAKVISKAQLIKEHNAYEAIKQEISLMKEVNSDMLIKVHQVLEDSEYIYLIIDLFNGGTLQSKIDQKKIEYNINEIQTIMKQLLQGVQDLHSLKIMHRDIKPENILFKSNSNHQLVICDLGLATKWDIPNYLFQNVGTPGYVAPEVYTEKGKYDGICDIYSCGIILYQLLFHKLPFNGNCVEEIFEQNKRSEINFHDIPIRNKVDQIGVSLLKEMLEKDPKFRISSQNSLEHSFFSLTIQDLITDTDIPLELDLNVSTPQKIKQQAYQLYQKKKRQEIKQKYNFIIPNTPILGKQTPQVKDFSELTVISLDYQQIYEQNEIGISHASQIGTPVNNSLLKKTLTRSIKKNSSSSYSSSSQSNHESFQLQQNYEKLQKQQNNTNAQFTLFPQIQFDNNNRNELRSKSYNRETEQNQQNIYSDLTNQLQNTNSATCKRRSLFGQISPSYSSSSKKNTSIYNNKINLPKLDIK